MMKSTMSVKELLEILKRYDENEGVYVKGGEDGDGEWGILVVGDDIVLEY